MNIRDEHFKVTTFDELAHGAIFVAVIEETSVFRCIKAFWLVDGDKDPIFLTLDPGRPTLHNPAILGQEVIDVSTQCRIVPDVGPASLMDRMSEPSQMHGKMVLNKDKTSRSARVFLGAYYKEKGDAALYVDIASGEVVQSGVMHRTERLTLRHWYIETRSDQGWARES